MIASLKRGIRSLWSRKLYFAAMIAVPIGCCLFFLDLMKEGLPLRTPVAVVDMDHSRLSRTITRNLASSELTDVRYKVNTYAEGMNLVKSGKVYGFFLIPAEFERNAVSGRETEVSFYSNLTFFVPGSLVFKGFKTVAVTSAAGVAVTKFSSMGVSADAASSLMVPLAVQEHMPGNPWVSYNIYLSSSFVPGVLALMVLLVTAFSIASEIKRGTSRQWLAAARGSMLVALLGKLLPQTVVFSAVGICCQWMLYGWFHFPLGNHVMHMIVAMLLLVTASQSLAIVIVSVIPSLRFSVSICALLGILTFSVIGISFPVEQMYGAIGIFAWIIPMRYYLLIYFDQALNGIPIYYSRWYYIALLVFPLLTLPGLRKLRNHCENPVYIP